MSNETATRQDKASSDLEWGALVERIAGRAVSETGAARARALRPAETRVEARDRAALTRDALSLLRDGAPIPVSAVPDVAELLDRIERNGVASGPELRDLGRLLAAEKALRAFVAQHEEEHPALAARLATSASLDSLREEIVHAIDEEGSVLDRASPALGRARKRVAELRRELSARLTESMNRYADVLRDKFYTEREGRFVLPVRADAHLRVEGIVFGSSASGGTLYVEPKEITELGNRRHVAEAEVEREVARVLGALSISARTRLDELRGARDAATLADVLMALARFAEASEAEVVDVDDGAEIRLVAMRHPLLIGGGIDVVPVDLRLAGGHGLVISGPNAGGKTVALKCLGLAAWMARAGIPIPADPASRVAWFDPVLTDIGDEQSLARSLSTFSAHAARLSSYIARADAPREDDAPSATTLVLLDEIAAGTDPDEGAALASAVLERLVGSGAAVAITTHYERLKQLAATDPRFDNASVGFDFTTMRPTFRVTLGVPGASSALAVAARYGIPAEVVARAEALIPETHLAREKLLAEIEVDRTRAAEERRAAEADARAQAELRRELEEEVKYVRERERARLQREGSELTARVREARDKLRDVTTRLKKGEVDREELRAMEKAVNAAGREVALGGALDATLRGASSTEAKAVENVAVGATVYVPKLRANAEVIEAPARGQVRVAAGALKLTLRLDEIALARGPVAKPAKKPKLTAPPVRRDATPVRTESITCDVRGLRVDEALERVDAFIDRLLSHGEPAGFVLHGHGTGALKAAIREHLGAHHLVSKARPADDDQGGDAFTVLWTTE
ncbi:MAG TPA: Smr/MutS family protein [Polyangiaceae bacterium]|nr:Smr/MutS family protein [Polyangiaceae bacterium]